MTHTDAFHKEEGHHDFNCYSLPKSDEATIDRWLGKPYQLHSCRR